MVLLCVVDQGRGKCSYLAGEATGARRKEIEKETACASCEGQASWGKNCLECLRESGLLSDEHLLRESKCRGTLNCASCMRSAVLIAAA